MRFANAGNLFSNVFLRLSRRVLSVSERLTPTMVLVFVEYGHIDELTHVGPPNR